jgi:MFS transporter, PPP family, 3-phenylpropionic acid transporter
MWPLALGRSASAYAGRPGSASAREEEGTTKREIPHRRQGTAAVSQGMTVLATARTPWALRVLYLVIGAWTAAIAPFSAVILHSRGIDTVTIGLLSAVAAFAATVLVPAWGHLADVVVGRTRAFQIGLAVASLAAITLLLPLPPQVLAPILASFGVFPAMFQALGDAVAVDELAEPERQYGTLRALASLSFAVGVIVAGFIYDQAGYAAVPLVALGWSGLFFLLIARVPDRTRDPQARAIAGRTAGGRTAGRFGSISLALSIQPRLWAVLGVFAVAYTGLMGAVIFVSIRIVELGGQPSDVALSFGVASFAEIPGLVMAGWIVQRVGMRSLVVVALLAYGLCIASWGVLPTPIAINATRVVTGLLFGALAAARVLIVARLLPAELQATGQTMLQAATFGSGSALGGLVGGVLYGTFGPTVFFAVAGAMAIAGALGAWIVLGGPVGARHSNDPEVEATGRPQPGAEPVTQILPAASRARPAALRVTSPQETGEAVPPPGRPASRP